MLCRRRGMHHSLRAWAQDRLGGGKAWLMSPKIRTPGKYGALLGEVRADHEDGVAVQGLGRHADEERRVARQARHQAHHQAARFSGPRYDTSRLVHSGLSGQGIGLTPFRPPGQRARQMTTPPGRAAQSVLAMHLNDCHRSKSRGRRW